MSRLVSRKSLLMSLGVIALLAAMVFGGVASAQARPLHLDGVRTQLTLEPATAGALLGLGVIPLPVWPTPVVPTADSLRYSFPVTGGRVDSKTLVGNIRHSGGLLLAKADIGGWKSLKLTHYTITIKATEAYITATVNGGPRVKILTLDLTSAAITKYMKHHRSFVKIANVGATLTDAATAPINTTFGSMLPNGIKLGTAVVLLRVAR